MQTRACKTASRDDFKADATTLFLAFFASLKIVLPLILRRFAGIVDVSRPKSTHVVYNFFVRQRGYLGDMRLLPRRAPFAKRTCGGCRRAAAKERDHRRGIVSDTRATHAYKPPKLQLSSSADVRKLHNTC